MRGLVFSTTGGAQGDELVLGLNHAVVAGLRVGLAQFAHGLGHGLVEREAEAMYSRITAKKMAESERPPVERNTLWFTGYERLVTMLRPGRQKCRHCG